MESSKPILIIEPLSSGFDSILKLLEDNDFTIVNRTLSLLEDIA